MIDKDKLDEHKETVDWLVAHGMKFEKALILMGFMEATGASLPESFVTLESQEESDE